MPASPRTGALPVTHPAWTSDLGERMRRHLVLKFLGVSAFMWVFFLGYFHVQRSPIFEAHLMPLIALDAWVPFQPGMFWVYVSLWVYVGIAPGLLLTVRELLQYGAWAALLCAVGLLIFYIWPTAVPPSGIDTAGYPGFAVLQGVDQPSNACPSLHVATSVYTACWVARLLRLTQAPMGLHIGNVVWVLAIAWSTVAIRQHVVLDVVAGAAFGLAMAALALRASPRLGARAPGSAG